MPTPLHLGRAEVRWAELRFSGLKDRKIMERGEMGVGGRKTEREKKGKREEKRKSRRRK